VLFKTVSQALNINLKPFKNFMIMNQIMVFALLGLNFVAGIFEKNKGLNDWQIENIGQI
jgi:hypothetical protein